MLSVRSDGFAALRIRPSHWPRLRCLLTTMGLYASSCATSDSIQGTTSGSSGDTVICALHNCSSDSDCGACSAGRHLCNVRDRRCQACDVATGAGCYDDEVCSSFGTCIPNGLDCPTDDHGVPTVFCTETADCAACNVDHQVCTWPPAGAWPAPRKTRTAVSTTRSARRTTRASRSAPRPATSTPTAWAATSSARRRSTAPRTSA